MRCAVFFFVSIAIADSFNILVVNDFPARSAFVFLKPILKRLAILGHNLTVISNFAIGEKLINYNEILINGTSVVVGSKHVSDLQYIESIQYQYKYFTPSILSDYSTRLCEIIFSTEAVQNLHNNKNNHFDVIFLNIFHSECIFHLAKQYGCPIIGYHATLMVPWAAGKFGLPLNPAVVPSNFLPFGAVMRFFERVENTVVTWGHILYNRYVMVPRDKQIIERFFGSQEANELEGLGYNSTLLLLNTHYSVNLPRVTLPNIVEIGGIHIGLVNKLPEDIEKWINESEHGVIYFSFGSLVRGHTMPAEKRQAFINAFRRLPQRVIWKWENDTMEGKTDNILIGKWMPQFDILSHPNVKAFISHGGLLGTFEAVHCGVPVLVMPQFGDQHTNAKALESVGGGEVLYLSDATEEKIYNALTKILSPSYQQQAKELSERFRDRPMSPLDTAIYWVEYVARHKGAHFMKTAAVGMPFYQYYLLDVIAFIIAVLIIFFYVSYLILRFLFRLMFKQKATTKKVKKS